MSGDSFDAVVIGSGLGGLTAAALLAKAGRKVCVIERNSSFGGAASIFKVGALTIEASLHQTADPRDPDEPKHEILKSLGLLDQIEWIKVRPFLSMRGGLIGEPFELPVGFAAAREAMAERFPRSREGIARLFDRMETTSACVADLNRARAEHSLQRTLKGVFKLRPVIADWRASLDEVLSRTLGDDEAAKMAIAGNLGYYADDPRRTWWTFFAVAQAGYLRAGGVYIKGGSRVLSLKLAQIVTHSGGQVLLGREATALDVDEEGRVAGVRHVETKSRQAEGRVAAKAVFANSAPSALEAMLPKAQREAFARPYLGRELSTSLFTANFGLSAPPAKFGLTGYGVVRLPDWMKSLNDLPTSATLFSANPGDRLPSYGIANFAAIDSGLAAGGPSLVVVAGLDRLSNWEGLTPSEEKDRRQRWLDALQAALDRDYPGFSAAVTDRLFLNARSMLNFLHTPGGAVYGFAPTPPRRGLWAGMPSSPKTPIPGLYLASSFGGSGGFTGAMLAGADAARIGMAETVR